MNTLSSLLALSLALVPALAAAQQHDHGAHAAHQAHATHDDHAAHDAHAAHGAQDAHAAPAAIPANHVPWTPDAPLVEGMARVREAVGTLAHHEMGHLEGSQVLILAGEIDAAIEHMFANCRLEPEPDAALHGVLARLMAGTKALREAPEDPAPVAGLRAALADYAGLFDDPAPGHAH